MQSYIKSLRAADTPISTPVVITAAEGIVQARDQTFRSDTAFESGMQRRFLIS